MKAEDGPGQRATSGLASGPLARSSALPSGMAKALWEIKGDTSSGAAEIAEQAAKLLLDALEQAQGAQIRALGRALIDAQPAMAPMVNLVNHLFHSIQSIEDPQQIREKGRAAVQAFLDDLHTASEKIKGHALGLLKGKKRVVTHSYSSTVLGVLEHARGIEVICPESRPLAEGLRTAKALGKQGIQVRLVTDFAALSLVGESDLVMVGADAITVKGVVNKIGTYGLALAAKDKKIPFYVLAGREKFLPPPFSDAIRIERKDPTEITRESIPNTVVENCYFEFTPLDLIAGVVTQGGVLLAKEVLRHVQGQSISKELQRG
jgi:translation initiation factor 2B subunit (eIF-2B alpha/beta/delta family)